MKRGTILTGHSEGTVATLTFTDGETVYLDNYGQRMFAEVMADRGHESAVGVVIDYEADELGILTSFAFADDEETADDSLLPEQESTYRDGTS